MEKRLTCATITKDSLYDKDNHKGDMCKFCSGIQFKAKTQEPYWKCMKYNVELVENEENWLLRCKKCLLQNEK